MAEWTHMDAQGRAKKKGVDMPVSEAVSAVLEGKISPSKAVEVLLSRDPKQEN